jgi:Spy/CpxP family protein refolding chaperone
MKTTRCLALAGALLLCAAAVSAQRGPGGGGGMMGGSHSLMSRDRGPVPESQPPMRRGLQLAPPGRWWDDHKITKHLSLRSDQQSRMDEIFETNKPKLQTLLTNLQIEESKLGNLSPSDLQDETKVFAAIDRVTQAHADLEKAEAHTELQIRQQLDPTQVAQLDREIAEAR